MNLQNKQIKYEIEDCPEWLMRKLRIISSMIPGDCYVGGFTSAAILFGGKFGPLIEPYTTELVGSDENLDAVIRLLQTNCSDINWSKMSSRLPVCLRDVIIKLEGDRAYMFFPSETSMDCLKSGVVELDFEQGSNALIRTYPGLTINGTSFQKIMTSHSDIDEEASNKLLPHRKESKVLFPEFAIDVVRNIRLWHEEHPPRMLWVTSPCMRFSEITREPWTAEDEKFRLWLLGQAELVYSAKETEADAIIRRVFLSQCTSQKGTHQGWQTWQHAICSTLLLETDDFSPNLRFPMRIAMLMHDIGKITEKTTWTTGCHAALGAKIWNRSGIAVDAENHDLVTFLIRNHDMLGLLDKTIKNPSLPGGLSLENAVDRLFQSPLNDPKASLKMICAVNDADIGSLSSLRYLLGLTRLLERLVEIGIDKRML